MKKNNSVIHKKRIPPKKETEVGPEEFEEQASKDLRMKPQPLTIPERDKKAKEKKK